MTVLCACLKMRMSCCWQVMQVQDLFCIIGDIIDQNIWNISKTNFPFTVMIMFKAWFHHIEIKLTILNFCYRIYVNHVSGFRTLPLNVMTWHSVNNIWGYLIWLICWIILLAIANGWFFFFFFGFYGIWIGVYLSF